MAETLYILFEHASGYGLFHIREFGEVMDEKNLADAVADLSKFNSVVKLVAFAPFKSGQNALDNLNAISEGLLHEDLRTVLEANLPKGGKKQKVMLGVGDSRIRDVIQEDLGIPCRTSGNIPDLLRGIRYHIHHFVSGLTEVSSQKAQLGLGHCYSRAKVKFNVNRVDNMIIQSICLLDQLDKDINTFSMRVREWYSYHFPELIKIVSDNHMFARMVNLIGDRKTLTGDHQELLTEIIGDEAKSAAVIAAARASMGMDISEVDLLNIKEFSKRVVSLTDFRKSLADYLRDKMDQVAPNLSTLIGEQVGARLISHAGSLTNLAKNPASTVQILGAEKALFRALKTRGNTPKYGLIYHSTFIGRANASDKGRISRYLANKCSIASRIDCFSEHPTSVFGEKLRDQVEERLAFLGGGATPAKNIDVMKAAVAEAATVLAEQKLLDKKRKKKKKRDADEMNDTVENGEDGETEEPPKKKKKKKDKENGDASKDTSGLADTTVEEETPGKKKKKKKKSKENGDDTLEDSALAEASMDVDDTPAKKQKKKKKKKDRGSE